MPDESQQLELAVTQDAPPQGDEQDTARTSETTPGNTDGVEQTSATDTEGKEVKSAETDEQKNQRVQQEEQDRAAKRSRGVQKRMDELTRDKYAERQARESLEKQNAELLAMLKGNTTRTNQPADGRPTQDQFSDFQEFIRADAVWHARQESVREAKALLEENLKTQNDAQQRQAREYNERSIDSAYQQRQRDIAKSIPDYQKTMDDGAQDITVPDSVFHMIRRMPNGPLVAYHLVKNPSLTDQFYTSPPEMHGILLGQLSATLKGPAKVSNAPSPGTPVKAKTGASSAPPEDTGAYMAWAEKNMR